MRIPNFLIRAVRAIHGLFASSSNDAELGKASDADGTDDPDSVGAPQPVWCVVANIVTERGHGPGGAEQRRGTKHFAPGAKVYVYNFFWGTAGERVTVVGRHRKSRRFIRLAMPSRHLANWRVELVYSPYVIRQIREHGAFTHHPPASDEARQAAERIAAQFIRQGAPFQPYNKRVPSAPEPPSPRSSAMPTPDRSPVERLMLDLLSNANFDFAHPDPHIAWDCFKRFAALPIPQLTTITIGFECLQYDDRDDVLWLSFMRRFEEPATADGAGSVGCLFRRTAPPLMIGMNAQNWWWPEHGTIETWAGDVERMPSFRGCLGLDGWTWEGLSE